MFSQELTKKAQVYFSERFNREISYGEAEDYLNSLADLYLSFGGEAGFPAAPKGRENQPDPLVIFNKNNT